MRKQLVAATLAAAVLTSGLPIGLTHASAESREWKPETVGVYEAEAGTFSGKVHVENKGYVTGFENDGDQCTVRIEIAQPGFYDLEFLQRSKGGHKENYVSVDGQRVGTISADGSKFSRAAIRRVYLETGAHTVSVEKYWGYIDWDKVYVLTSEPFDESVFDVSARLVNPNATDNARRLFSYLCDQYGKAMISGQYCDTGMNGWECLKMNEVTGKYPAILGMDMGYYSQNGIDHNASVKTTQQAITCWNKGGIVTLCWHWLAPEKYIKDVWYSGFRTTSVNMNLTAMMNGQDDEGLALLMQDIRNIAEQLLLLQEAGVPVLWRPLHEASGGWFWWGAEGPDTYKKLYILLYKTLTEDYGLNNLIWVWNGQDSEWYPGDEYVDIVGTDIYAGEHEYSSQMDTFLQTLHSSTSRKMVVLSENGTLIDPDLAVRDRAMWGFFCTWSGEFVLADGVAKKLSERYTEIDMLKKVYDSEYVISRDELPDLRTYPIREDAR